VNHKKAKRLYREVSLTVIKELRALAGMEMRKVRDLDEIGDIVLKKVSMIQAKEIKNRITAIGKRSI
jgi:ribosomal protein L7/L12